MGVTFNTNLDDVEIKEGEKSIATDELTDLNNMSDDEAKQAYADKKPSAAPVSQPKSSNAPAAAQRAPVAAQVLAPLAKGPESSAQM